MCMAMVLTRGPLCNGSVTVGGQDRCNDGHRHYSSHGSTCKPEGLQVFAMRKLQEMNVAAIAVIHFNRTVTV